MKIEEIARAAIEALQNASIEELEEKCKQFGYTPTRKERHNWQVNGCYFDMSLVEKAVNVLPHIAMMETAGNDDPYQTNDKLDNCAMAA